MIATRLPALLLVAGAVLTLLPFFFLTASAFPSADDYCVAVAAQRGGWQMQVQSYTEWTGRYAATLFLTLVSQWDLASMYPWLCAATLAATVCAIRALVRSLVGRDTPGAHVTAAAIVAAAVLIAGQPSVTEAFFWMTSAVTYQWALITYLAWVALLIRIAGDPATAPRMPARWAAGVLTVLLPGFNEVMMPLVLATIGGFAVASSTRRHASRAFMWVLFAMTVSLTSLAIVAPGNSFRSGIYPDSHTRHNLAFASLETARQMIAFVGRHGFYPAVWMLGVVSWWLAPWLPGRTLAAVKQFPLGGGWSFSVLLAAIGYFTLFPLYWEYGADNYTGQGRPYNVTFFVFCVLAVWITWSALSAASARWTFLSPARVDRRVARSLLAAALAVLLVGSDGSRRAFRASREAADYLTQQQLRESILRSFANQQTTVVVVDAVRVRPDGLFWGDIQAKPNHWINSCVAEYYGVDSVRTTGP